MTAITEVFAPLLGASAILAVICLAVIMALTFPGDSK